MGNQVSIQSFDPAHVRIYSNILQIQNPHTRANMIQTCLAGQEYVHSAKRAGVYSFLLGYVSSVSSGREPKPLPGEQGHTATTTTTATTYVNNAQYNNYNTQVQSTGQWTQQQIGSQAQMAQQMPARQAFHHMTQINANAHPHMQMTQYEDPAKNQPRWMHVMSSPQEKVISYFDSCLETLNLKETQLDMESLKKAYRHAGRRTHPDKGGNEQEFEAVTRAYAYLHEVLLRIQGGRTVKSGEVEAPALLHSQRNTDADKWKHVEPVRLNPSKLDMNAFNQMFEKTHLPDPDTDGYGDWLTKGESTASSSAPKFSGKFNRDVFNKTFEGEMLTRGAENGANRRENNRSMILHPDEMALLPTSGTEIGRDRPNSYTAAPNSHMKYTDLKQAYTSDSTFTYQVADVPVENRNFDQYRSSREKAPDAYNNDEQQRLFQSEKYLLEKENARQRRKAEQDVLENRYFERMKTLVIADK
jgi:curved DNA-binding protein CbpA